MFPFKWITNEAIYPARSVGDERPAALDALQAADRLRSWGHDAIDRYHGRYWWEPELLPGAGVDRIAAAGDGGQGGMGKASILRLSGHFTPGTQLCVGHFDAISRLIQCSHMLVCNIAQRLSDGVYNRCTEAWKGHSATARMDAA
jgi:hypothetical protein